MKKILMLSTGGTIASEESEEGLVPKLTGARMVEMIPELHGLCEIECKTILNLDSTNMQPEEWSLMAREAYQGLKTYDGIVLTHGTDTMGYSAAALSLMLQALAKPVVLTGSQLPIGAPNTDAKRNIYHAFLTAQSDLAGVFVVFDGKVIDGRCASKLRTEGFDAFVSVNRPLVGSLEEGRLTIEHPPATAGHGEMRLDERCDPDVLLCKLTPGFRPETLDLAAQMGFHGIVLEAFGLGGVPYYRRNLLPALERLIAAGIAVVVSTQCVYGGCNLNVYDVGVKALRAGVIPAGKLSSEAALTGLMWALGHTRERAEIARILQESESALCI